MGTRLLLPLYDMGHELGTSRRSGLLEADQGPPVLMVVDGGRVRSVSCGGASCPPDVGHDLQAMILIAFLAPIVSFTSTRRMPPQSRWSLSLADLAKLVAATRGRPYALRSDADLGDGVTMSGLPFRLGSGPPHGATEALDHDTWQVMRAAVSGALPRATAAMPWAMLAPLLHRGLLAVDGAERCPLIGWQRPAEVPPQQVDDLEEAGAETIRWSDSPATMRRLMGALTERA